MAKRPRERLEFKPTDPGEILSAMATISSAGEGWINLLPGIDSDDAPPPPTGIAAILAPRTPGAVMSTWAPPGSSHHQPHGATVGILHSAGRFAARQLVGLGAPVPEGWVIRQDNPRRGLIVVAPTGTTDQEVLDWTIAATTALCTLEISGDWLAEIFLPKSSEPQVPPS
jgi:hypothetical protein